MHPKGLLQLISSRVAMTAAAFLATVFAANASATVIVQDVFLNKPGTTWGQKLNTTTPSIDNTGITNNQWVANTFTVFFQNKNISTNTTDREVEARIQIGVPSSGATLEAEAVFRLNPKLDYGVGKKQAAWAAVGLFSSTTDSWFSASNLVWAMVDPNGNWRLWEKGTTSSLATGTLSTGAFAYGSTTTLSIKFNAATSEAALFIGADNISGWIGTSISASEISASGFRIHTNTGDGFDPGNAFVDQFTVSSIQAIPEPGSAALVMGGSLLAALCIARKRRT